MISLRYYYTMTTIGTQIKKINSYQFQKIQVQNKYTISSYHNRINRTQ
jgi:hypothetical protein